MSQSNPLLKLHNLGQSIWLDYIDRPFLKEGALQALIDNDGLAGLTSNPAIFEKAISGSDAYDEEIRHGARNNQSAEQILEQLTLTDVQRAADLFRPVYDNSGGIDGFVSLEVSPTLAHQTERTIEEARRLWQRLGRPNVMIKVPGTRAGIPAIKALITEGINVNVTLLFSVGRYVEALDAYLDGLEARLEQGHPIDHVASVASFFLSRIDVMIDKRLDEIAASDSKHAKQAKALRGQAAIASAAFAYKRFIEHSARERWHKLQQHGAHPQRPLWASTSTKDPSYSDVKYVEALIGPNTVNTLPPKTLAAYRDHGDPAVRLDDSVAQAPEIMKQLLEIGIDMVEMDAALEAEGVEKFVTPYQSLLETIEEQKRAVA